jgi:hypothetical protein
VTIDVPFDTGDDHTALKARGRSKESSTKCRETARRIDRESWSSVAVGISSTTTGCCPAAARTADRCVDRLTYDADGRIDRVHMTTEGVHGAGPARLV